MSTQQEKENGLIVNIPLSIKKEIDSAFPDYTENQLNKIYFIVFKICKEGNYQVNVRNHSDMLAFNTGTMTDILSKLRTKLIITTDGDYSIGGFSNSYRLMKKYDCESEDNYKVFYYPSRMKLPIWVQQYIYDGYTVYSKEYSKFRNQKKSEALTYDEQTKLIKRLQAEITSLRAQLLQSNASVAEDISTAVGALFKPVKTDNIYNNVKPDVTMCEAHSDIESDVIDAEDINKELDVYTLPLKNKTYYFMNHKIILNATTDEDDEAILINKLQDHKDGDDQSLVYNGKTIKFNKGRIANEIMIYLVA